MKKILFLIFTLCAVTAPAQELPEGLLGGLLKSDKWLIHKTEQSEEFIGNVRYESELYKLKSAYAKSDRKNNIFTLEKDVYLWNKNLKGDTSAVTADNVVFNLNTGAGAAAGNKTPLNIVYTTSDAVLEAESKTAAFNTKKETLTLKDNVKIKYTLPADFLLAFSEAAYVDRKNDTLRLSGNVELDTSQYSVLAREVSLDNKNNKAVIAGGRPVVTADKPEFSLAAQSERIEIDTLNQKIKAHGRINGWVQPKEDFNAAAK